MMPQLRALSDYLEEHPPLHIVAAALAGVKPHRRGEQIGSAATAAAFDTLLANSTAGHQGESNGGP